MALASAGPYGLSLGIATRDAARGLGPGEELYRLREALSPWHGPPPANVASGMLRLDAAPTLEQERLRVPERVCDLELAAGNCHQVLVDLYESGRRHPVRERCTEQLIEALYRTGRQAQALAEYHTVRDRLRDELGVDPGAGLRRPGLAILRSEELGRPEPAGARPALTRAAAPGVPAPPAEPASDSGWRGVPRTRPGRPGLSPAPRFAERQADRAAIAARLTSAEGPQRVVVSGAPGSGKSAPTHQCAYEVRDEFPGGVFTFALTRPDGSPLSPDEAQELLPGPGDGGRRLLVLDDAAGAGQVLPADHAPDFAPDVRTALPAGVRALRAAAPACLGSPR
ncbi:AfsR/SARP family transcriptional regulator [Streptomyces sp. NBC_01296]|uniref:AfsR/SARP family transcriptional regulator n=1 Tax=Streptomyces sp. NBC_01296 TaxID=2903816 RepID=UPI002E0E74F7|nr:AfsR/SARP family transcriptional regulator [Streptomyces sp. NBC_01296]